MEYEIVETGNAACQAAQRNNLRLPKVEVHVLNYVLTWPDDQLQMLINDPAGVVRVRGELLGENNANRGRLSFLSFKYQFRPRAPTGVDRAGKAARRALERHAVHPLKRKATGETTAERAEYERRGDGANK
jgi:hypothetical protein